MKLQTKAINLSATLTPAMAQQSAVLSLTKPNASVVTKTILTDPNGHAIAQFALSKSDQRGTYQGSVHISVSNQTVSDTVSILVR